ncbi:MAG TPA: hypothetical protein VHQ47_19685 [Phycisphaerae bacterium]|jgi:hypothetical protein|nr:hypothetical protein [Phycisphaerae bacterium]
MNRVDSIRATVSRLWRAVPFKKFVLTLENGDRVVVEHPENVAFDPTGKSDALYVLSRDAQLISTLSAVTGIVMKDDGQAAA